MSIITHNRELITPASDEYQTPKKYIKAAKLVMGSIDLDPACSDKNFKRLERYVGTYYNIEQNGLSKNWSGNVWLNEPYSKPNLTLWTDYLINQYNFGIVDQAINLVPSFTSERWYQRLLEHCTCFCLPNHRIYHLINGKTKISPRFASTFFYFGYYGSAFTSEFSRFGKTFQI